MTNITLAEAQAILPAIINGLRPGEEVTICESGQPVALVRKANPPSGLGSSPSKAGCYAKPELWMSPDFDAPWEDFREYLA